MWRFTRAEDVGARERMPKLRVSMRWWLALTFAVIVALTAVVVAQLFTTRVERLLDARAEQIASGNAFTAAREIADALGTSEFGRTVQVLAKGRKLSLFVFGDGRMIAAARYRPIRFGDIPQHREALARARSGRRYVERSDNGRSIVVGLPLRSGALVTVALRRDLVAEAGLLRGEIVRSALWAVLIGALAGLLVAVAIAARLRRIAAAATAIEEGDFALEIREGFGDEVGQLAATIDRMRRRLQDSFEQLESERDRLRALLEQLQDGVVAVNRELRVTFANRVAHSVFDAKVREDQVLPEFWADLPLRALAAHLFEPGAGVAQARVSPTPETTFAVSGVPARAGSLALLVVADVSARERRERAEREFVANAAHELRTPITAIANAIEALETGAKETDERDRFLAIIDRQTKRVGRLVRALLALARAQTRQETLRLEPVLLGSVLTEVADGLETLEGVDVTVTVPAGLAALAHRDLLLQVVGNLAANAAKHTSDGVIELAARSDGPNTVVLEVTDTGSGIDAYDEERVFDRFYSNDRGQRHGFGLGLAIVREAVGALGGTVEIESAPGRGTAVRVTLTAAATAAA